MTQGFIIPLAIQDRLSRGKLITMFPYQGRAIGDYYYTLDMEGYAKAVLILSPLYTPPPSIVLTGSTVGSGDLGLMIDGNLTTGGNFTVTLGQTGGVIVDFGNIANRQAGVNIGSIVGGTSTSALYVSTDNITYIPASGTQSCRYIKFLLTNTSGVQATTITVNEIYDGLVFGGTATVSFQALDPSSNQYVDVVKGSDIGAVSSGQPSAVQIGDTLAQVGLNRVLPTLFTQWRVHLSIINAGIGIGISLIKTK